MHSALLHTHNLLRWVVLVLGVLAIVRTAQGLGGATPFAAARKSLSMFMGTVHLQLLIGLLLLMNSPIVQAAMRDMEATMADRALRQVVVEHPTLMVLAAILITVGSIVAKNRATDAAKHKLGLTFAVITMVVILAGIPWQRALFPGMN
ncbi:hypothetical protein Strain138_001824 [Pseudogemmatithrix spongiicola]|uniref:Cytochrome B n=1 Tax=Pseudogemmatithrix spongiicola TaxID=3062599 RepID=A0AA49K1D0_9BACT|nr:hypothetical protein Strain138_001824 [Gemmatimonadaceae bacterium 'strain 138']WKW15438.1 hypothetical protein Strain318_001823 [Gemmatimonadaceae bacterium 'strain 318']